MTKRNPCQKGEDIIVIKSILIRMLLLTCYTGGVVVAEENKGETLGVKGYGQGRYSHMTTDDFIRSIVEHPAFKGFGMLILPKEHDTYYLDTPLSKVYAFMPYHQHVDTEIVVGGLNRMIDEVSDGKTVFYDFYTDQQNFYTIAIDRHQLILY